MTFALILFCVVSSVFDALALLSPASLRASVQLGLLIPRRQVFREKHSIKHPSLNMPLSIPPELKKISPFIKRAEELDKDKSAAESRLVAYYCRQYAVHLGIQLAGSSPEAKACLGEILGDLEKEKAAMDNFTKDEAAFLCRKFAYSIFERVDAEDRAGNAGKSTAKSFYAAASFLEILAQFSSDEEQAQEDKKKIVYSKWKATEILKAIKEGRTPTPGGYKEDELVEEEPEEGELSTPQPFIPPPMSPQNDIEPPVDTVMEGEEERNVSPITTMPPPSIQPPSVPPPEMPPPPAPFDFGDEGTEVELGPPPTYPGEEDNGSKLNFQPTPTSKAKAKSGIFGFGNNKKPSSSKAQIQDATELTKFALAALEDKDADLAAERLKKALAVLGR